MSTTENLLRNCWYFGLPSKNLKAKKAQEIVILGEPIVLFRNSKGEVQALRDLCPHRGIPLHFGQVVQDEIECPYHGWTFNGDGVCTSIPSLCEGQDLDCRKIRIKNYPAQEMQGNIWVFVGDKDFDLSKAPPLPAMNFFPLEKQPQYLDIVDFPCHLDHAVIGLMDPAHGPFVHKSWFWRTAKSIHEKKKSFGPSRFGFQMNRHLPSKNSKAYKILGGKPTTEIRFTLPSCRVEHVQVGLRSFVSMTALVPVSPSLTRVYQMAYWDIPWLSLVKPLITSFAKTFLNQDLQAVTKQQVGLKYDPSLMLIKDADTQAKWYFSLKNEYELSLKEKREFQNPVKETELRWRS